jgi:oxygen-independent coproporphyrinogen-3 oxidase
MRQALVSELNHNLKAYSANLLPSDLNPKNTDSTPLRQPIIKSIFFGGGTPSLSDPETFKELIDIVKATNPPNTPLEVTMEANPTSIETKKLRAFHQAGVNRLSMGVQSLDDDDLKYLGRNHSVADALRCYDIARSIFEKVSFDLIYARHPNQTVDKWRLELRKALKLNPTHLSLYQLTFEPGTPFYRALETGKLSAPSSDLSADLYDVTIEETSEHGLNQYEVSNFAVEGYECAHNLNYWQLGDYLGIGPGAASRITLDVPAAGKGPRRRTVRASGMCTKAPTLWRNESIQRGYSSHFEFLSPRDSFLELMLTGIRTRRGISIAQMADILEIPHDDSNIQEQLSMHLDWNAIRNFISSGLLSMDDPNFLRSTKQGMMISDHILKSIVL